MIEQRKLTKEEFEQLLKEAVNAEGFKQTLEGVKIYDFFNDNAVEQSGIVNSRPLYFGALVFNKLADRYELWSIVSSKVKEQKSLYKITKKTALDWAKKYGSIYATMEKTQIQNMNWIKRMGFGVIEDKGDLITLRLQGGQ
jgi:hypothetical protein